MQSGRVPVTYVPTSRGWVQAHPAQPFNSQAPPMPAGFGHDTWRNGNWQENPRLRGAPVQGQAVWIPHPAWYPGNASAGPPAVDVERAQWLWVPPGFDVRNPASCPAAWRGDRVQTPQTEDSFPPSLPASPPPDFPRVRVSERFRNGRDSPHPHPGQRPPMDDDYDSSPDYGPFRVDASARAASTSSRRHSRGASRSNTYSSFGTPESAMSPPVIPPPAIPSSGSSHHLPHNYPSGSSRSHTPYNSSSQPYPGLPPRHNPLPPPPEHNPLAQSLLQKANRPTAPDAHNR